MGARPRHSPRPPGIACRRSVVSSGPGGRARFWYSTDRVQHKARNRSASERVVLCGPSPLLLAGCRHQALRGQVCAATGFDADLAPGRVDADEIAVGDGLVRASGVDDGRDAGLAQ